jgi:DNA-binding transcriptional regulator YiaG
MKTNDMPALVKELRDRLDLTQWQFAQKVGVTYSTVNHWENGKRIPQPFLVRRLLELKEEIEAQANKSKGRER